MPKIAYTVFCDDIRMEVNGKTSIIGAYAGALYTRTFPVHLPKLCAWVVGDTTKDDPFKGFRIEALLNGNVIGELDVPEEQHQQQIQSSPDATNMLIQAQMIFSPILLSEPGELRINFISDGQKIECTPLKILQAPDDMPIVA